MTMKMNWRSNSTVLLSLILMLVISLVTAACELVAPIKIENKTNEVLTVYIEKYHIGDVKPNDKIKNDLVNYRDWYLIEMFDTQEDIVYSHKFSAEELEKMDWNVVIPPLQSK